MCILVYKEHGQIACATSLLRGTAACSFSGQGFDCLPDLCVMPASSPTATPECDAVWPCCILHNACQLSMSQTHMSGDCLLSRSHNMH